MLPVSGSRFVSLFRCGKARSHLGCDVNSQHGYAVGRSVVDNSRTELSGICGDCGGNAVVVQVTGRSQGAQRHHRFTPRFSKWNMLGGVCGYSKGNQYRARAPKTSTGGLCTRGFNAQSAHRDFRRVHETESSKAKPRFLSRCS